MDAERTPRLQHSLDTGHPRQAQPPSLRTRSTFCRRTPRAPRTRDTHPGRRPRPPRTRAAPCRRRPRALRTRDTHRRPTTQAPKARPSSAWGVSPRNRPDHTPSPSPGGATEPSRPRTNRYPLLTPCFPPPPAPTSCYSSSPRPGSWRSARSGSWSSRPGPTPTWVAPWVRGACGPGCGATSPEGRGRAGRPPGARGPGEAGVPVGGAGGPGRGELHQRLRCLGLPLSGAPLPPGRGPRRACRRPPDRGAAAGPTRGPVGPTSSCGACWRSPSTASPSPSCGGCGSP